MQDSLRCLGAEAQRQEPRPDVFLNGKQSVLERKTGSLNPR